MSHIRRILPVLLGALALCSPERASAAPGDEPPGDLLGNWTAVSATGPDAVPAAQIKPVSVRFEAKAGFLWASIRGGCNELRAAGSINGTTIALGQLVATRKACAAPLAQVDDFVTTVFKGPGSYTIGADGLAVITSGARTLTLQRVPDDTDDDSDAPGSNTPDSDDGAH